MLGTPRARIIRETIRAWFSILNSATNDEIADIRLAWSKARDSVTQLLDDAVCGLMSNIILILHRAKWIPRLYNRWSDGCGTAWVLSGGFSSPDLVANTIIKSYADLDLERAQAHYCGKGMGQGVHFPATLGLIRTFKASNYAEKCLLENILSASCWTAERIHSINPDYSPLCNRCGQHDDSPLHCYWTCPANADIQHDDIIKSQHLINGACAGSVDFPCLWLRGILPSSFIHVPDHHLPTDDYQITWVNPTILDSGTYYGDASGGAYTSFPELRRVGCAFASIDNDGQLVTAAHFPLPGTVQTVPRGELFTLVELLNHISVRAIITFVTDN